MVRACWVLLVVTFGVASAEPRTRAEAIAEFDKLSWSGGGRGLAGRVKALRAAGFKPRKTRPRIDVDIRLDQVVVVERHDVLPAPCPPCACTPDKTKCAPCVMCVPKTNVRFAAKWSRQDDRWTQQGPVAVNR